MNVTRMFFYWVSIKNYSSLLCGTHCLHYCWETFYCLKPFIIQLYNLGCLFVLLCLGWQFSHLFLVSSEFLLGICVCCCLLAQSCPTLCHPMDCKPTSLFCSRGFSRQEYWSGLPCSPSGIFPTHGSNPGLPYCRRM